MEPANSVWMTSFHLSRFRRWYHQNWLDCHQAAQAYRRLGYIVFDCLQFADVNHCDLNWRNFPLWQYYKIICSFLEGLFIVWLLCYWANFHCCKLANIEHIITIWSHWCQSNCLSILPPSSQCLSNVYLWYPKVGRMLTWFIHRIGLVSLHLLLLIGLKMSKFYRYFGEFMLWAERRHSAWIRDTVVNLCQWAFSFNFLSV